ncbi:uncharacterized protein LOC123683248 isoform X2 [Harmonia axyridis]|uniref:uncharacterized protein LOC123683248 isoform X2 n=1 Tax=Harmonia axyridis TaxID=115357 RepID=UPI001E277D0C|nr:uncharacterized protein LOC123683248 isoform X2 [Harmonia axyridis]
MIRGKRHKPVPVLFSSTVQKYIEQLLKHRDNFVSKENIYLFATPGKLTCLDGYTALKIFAKECGAEHPQALTSGKLRKHIATISQVSDLSQTEMEQLCTFLGHTLSTHNNYYRLPQEIYQTAKLTKLLLKSQDENIENSSDNDENLNEELHSEEEEEVEEDIPALSSDNNLAIAEKDASEQKSLCRKNQKRKTKIPEKTSNDFDEEEEERLLKMQKVKRKRVSNNSSDSEEKETPKVKHPKIRWTEQQKNATVRYFQTNIHRKKTHTEGEIKEFKSVHPFMNNKTWKQIKAFVFNAYRNK